MEVMLLEKSLFATKEELRFCVLPLLKSQQVPYAVTPAKAGVQNCGISGFRLPPA